MDAPVDYYRHEEVALAQREVDTNLARGIEQYEHGDAQSMITALYLLCCAYEGLQRLGDDANPNQSRMVLYYLFKADAMSTHLKERVIELPLNPQHLESLIDAHGTSLQRRAVKAYERHGRLGLKVHDMLERRGH